MTSLIRKLHIYIGLLNFSNLIVFGIAGLVATFHSGLERKPASTTVRYENFTPAPGSTDPQIAHQIFDRFRFPLAQPVPDWTVHRDSRGDLPLEFYTVSTVHKVTYLASQARLRIEDEKANVWFFLDDVHTVTSLRQPDWRIRLWAWYNNFAIWSLIAMALSGTYLWLASRPRYRIAQYSFAGGTAAFIALWFLVR